ncbi:glycerophosphoryl diester phosphodiesterase [Okibacterium sp. HSC-33S16]|nr:glycerophosphoryl diester phosphodiesterase [Okibacterium sp. HSC-33S16]
MVIAILQAVNYFAVIPAIRALFTLALRVSGLENVTDRTLLSLLSAPLADLLLFAIAVIALAALGVQLSATVIMINRQQSGLPTTMSAVMLNTGKALRKILHVQFPLLLFYLVLVIPLAGVGLASALMPDSVVPQFVTREFMKTPIGALGCAAFVGIVIYLNLRLSLILPTMIVGREPLAKAFARSFKATRSGLWHVAGALGLSIGAAAVAGSFLVEVLVFLTANTEGSGPAIASAIIAMGHAFGFILIGAATVVVLQILVRLTRDDLGLPSVPAKQHTARAPLSMAHRMVGLAVVVIASIAVSQLSAGPTMASASSGRSDAAILAHRGFVGGGVENTIEALEAAARTHPDYVEVDMQQTADGYFVASHDTNLLMVAGLNEDIFNMTLREATAVEQYQGGFTGKIPSMVDYVGRAAELKVPLMIELKIHGHESPDFLDRFLTELDSIDDTDQNTYHSLNADVVADLKERRPHLRVGYTIALSVGDVPRLDCDFFVIEQGSFTPEFLTEAHRRGKPVYVWTVNEEPAIRSLIRMGVDGIVTDIPDVAVRERDRLTDAQAPERQVADALSYLSFLR